MPQIFERRSENYHAIPRHFLKRYVRYDWDGKFKFIEVDQRDKRYDVSGGTVDEKDLRPSLVIEAKARRGIYPPYVEWDYN